MSLLVDQNTLRERSMQHSWMWQTCPHETTAGSGETRSEESSGSHQEPEDGAGFFDVKNDIKLPPGIVPEHGVHN
eukprot:12891048-Prorocentrum_lima.AAC.1